MDQLRTSGRLVRITFIVALLLLVLISSLFFWSRTRLFEDEALVEHTYQVIVNLENTFSTLKDAETDQRGYLITGDNTYLAPYQKAITSLSPKLDNLRQLTSDNLVQQKNLDQLQPLIDQKRNELQSTIDLRNSNGFQAAEQQVLANQTRQTMDAIRQIVDNMEAEERMLLDMRKQASQQSTQTADVISVSAAILSFGLLLGSFILLNRELSAREKAQAALRVVNESLEVRVQERTQELAAEVTERTLAQERERQQREWLQTALTSIGDAVLSTDNDSHVTFLNPNAEALTGWSQADALGQDVGLVFHIINEHTRQLAVNPIERVLREGVVVGLANHTVLIAKDGREIPIDDSGAPIRDMSGSTIGAILVFRDVTEQRRVQRVQSQLAAIVESSQDAIIGKDLDGIITSWNQGAERMYGYTAQETVGQSIAMLVPPDWTNDVPQILERIRRGERVEKYETKRMRKDGVVLDVALTVSPLYNEDGEVTGASKIARDITDQKKQAVELAHLYEAERNAHREVEAANQRLAFLNKASQLLSSSLDFEATFNTLRSIVLPNIADIYAIDMLQDDNTLRRVARGTVDPALEPVILELEIRTDPQIVLNNSAFRAGQSVILDRIPEGLFERLARDADHLALMQQINITSEILVPLRVRETLIGILTVIRRGERPAFTSNDLVLMEELAHRVAQAIDNARLYDEATRAVELRNEFLSVAAHELKTPVTSLRGFAQALTNQYNKSGALEPDRLQRGLTRIEEQSIRLASLINQLLEISRIESGRLILERTSTDMVALVRRIIDQADTSSHEIVLNADAAVEENIDPLRIEQVMTNLLDNAIKYSPNGGKIIIELTHAENNAIRLSVTDQGIGVSPDRRGKLFERFYQAHREGYAGGMGLGLYISRQIVELHGGQIDAEFPAEGGTRFVIVLPEFDLTP